MHTINHCAAVHAFDAGGVFATSDARALMFRAGLSMQALVRRLLRGDRGDVDAHDRAVNDQALAKGGRLVSVRTIQSGERLYVVTEADRSFATLLLPTEY